MKIITLNSIEELRTRLELSRHGRILEDDLNRVSNETELNGRKIHDAEVLTTLAANIQGNALDIGTSYGRSAFRIGSNLAEGYVVHTVNALPEQLEGSASTFITHELSKEQIGSFYKEKGVQNTAQYYADTSNWQVPEAITGVKMVFVDGAHDTAAVFKDSQLAYDLLEENGYLVWHDFSPALRKKYGWIDACMKGVEKFLEERVPNAEVIHLRDSFMAVLKKTAKPATVPDRTNGSPAVRLGLVLDLAFHQQNKWVSATTRYLVEAIMDAYDCRTIQSQQDYEESIGDCNALLSMEPGWASPKLDFTLTPGLREKFSQIPTYIYFSDPHANLWRQDYFLQHGFQYLLSFYYYPLRFHFRRIPEDRIVHLPWAVPDKWIGDNPVQFHGQRKICCFGGQKSEAYALRNWCRQFDFVESNLNSGCENKVMTDMEYIRWLSTKDACIAAGSDDPKYRLTVPKYFEIAASGALLLAQETEDVGLLGFEHQRNCIIFNRSNFEQTARQYLSAPQQYMEIRSKGRELIRQHHTISVRIKQLDEHLQRSLAHKQRRICPPIGGFGSRLAAVSNEAADKLSHDEEFTHWYQKICVPSALARAKTERLYWENKPLEWDATYEILAFQEFMGSQVSKERLLVMSNRRYELLDRLWPKAPLTRDKVEAFYTRSAAVVPWGHGQFLSDHKVAERRRNWLRRYRLLHMLRQQDVSTICEYGAGRGYTTLLAKAMGFGRVVHHEYSIFHPYIRWTLEQTAEGGGRFEFSNAGKPLCLDEPVDALICTDVAEHVWDPQALLKEIQNAMKPGGLLAWCSCFGEGISSHLHPDLKGHEEELLAAHGFRRVSELNYANVGHSGLYQAVKTANRSAAGGSVHAPAQASRPIQARTIDEILEANQWLSRDELERQQWNNLKLLLNHAYQYVPFYRRRFESEGIHPNDITAMDDFRKLPILRKADIQQYLEEMRATNYSLDRLMKDATGGSTGQPLVFYRDLNARQWTTAAARRFRRWMGYISTSKLALIWGADRDIPKIAKSNERWLNAFNCSEDDIVRFMRELVRWKPDAIRAYSSCMAIVAGLVQQKGIEVPHPRVIECAAEKLWDQQRKQIEDIFGCPVFEMYGSREIPALSSECQNHHGMHIFSDLRLVEAVKDNQTVADGQEGSLIITDLVNYGMPLIRYEIGDVGVISNEPCVCGRGFPLLKEIKGRLSSIVRTPDGRNIHGEYFTHLFYHVPGVKAFQIHQKTIDKVLVLIEPEKTFEPSVLCPVLAKMREHLGPEVQIECKHVDRIPLTPTGKRHFVLSDVGGDSMADGRHAIRIQTASEGDAVKRKKILFIVDKPGWAHDFKTDNLIRQLGVRYEMTKAFCDDVKAEQIQAADLVLVYYWKQMRHERMQCLMDVLRANRHKILMGICSHTELEGHWKEVGFKVLNELASGIFVNSRLLLDAYGGAFKVPIFYTPNGVDTAFYTPVERRDASSLLRIGWAGSLTNHGDIRGYGDFIVPAVQCVNGVELVTAAREEQWRTPEEMRQFYRSLDIYVCASLAEGTPNPCLEAAACGAALLTTAVGNMPELVQEGVNGFFIHRDIEMIAEKINWLKEHPEQLSAMKENARRLILAWDWKRQALNYASMFDKMLHPTDAFVKAMPSPPAVEPCLQLFQQAQQQFKCGNVKSAQSLIERYKNTVDYTRFGAVLSASRRSNPVFSVIVVTYNRPDDVGLCVDALRNQHLKDFEIIVVDNGDEEKKAASLLDRVDVYINCPINFNLSEGRNIGAHFARGQILVLLDDDALVGPNYLKSIQRAFEQYAILGLRGRAFPKTAGKPDQRIGVYDLGEKAFATICNQEGNAAFRRDVFLSIGGMDPLLFGHEGTDFTWRLVQRYQYPSAVIYWPETVIYHDYGDNAKFEDKQLRYQLNNQYIQYKHKAVLQVIRAELEKASLKPNHTGKLAAPLPEILKEPSFVNALPKYQQDEVCSVAAAPLQPKISVIMACHNAADYLAETMDSLLGQTMAEWELLAIDDGSTDGTASMLKAYAEKDARIRFWRFDDKKGPYVRRNFAIGQARTEFISIQDADDIMAPKKLQSLYDAIFANEQLGIVGSFYRRFLETFRGEDFGDRMDKAITHQDIMQLFPRTWHICWHGSAIIRKSLFEKIGLYDEQPYGSDTFWLSKAGLYGYLTGKVQFMNLPLYLTYKREHGRSQTGTINPVDPRSRRHKLETYYLHKLAKIMENARANPSLDVETELKACTCTDFIPRFGWQFEQWESQPLDEVMCRGITDKAMGQFAAEQYICCLITLNGLDVMTAGKSRTWRNLNLTRGLAAYAGGDDMMASVFLNEEIRLFGHAAAGALVRRIETASIPKEAWLRRKEIRDYIALAALKPQKLQTPVLSDTEHEDHQQTVLARQFSDLDRKNRAAFCAQKISSQA